MPVATVVFSLMQFGHALVSPCPASPAPVRAGRPFPRESTAPLLLHDTFLGSFIRGKPSPPLLPLHRRKHGTSPAQRHRCPHILTMPHPSLPPARSDPGGRGSAERLLLLPLVWLPLFTWRCVCWGEPLGCPAPAGPCSTCHRAASPVLPWLCIVVPNLRSMC